MHAYSLVTSRAFQVDAYHGAAMVPLADIFNHREDNQVCFEVSLLMYRWIMSRVKSS